MCLGMCVPVSQAHPCVCPGLLVVSACWSTVSEPGFWAPGQVLGTRASLWTQGPYGTGQLHPSPVGECC